MSLPIWAECALRAMFLALTASLMRSTSCWYRLRSRMAFSLASFSALSRALTLSAVALSRFSSLGSSQRRSALSRTNCKKRSFKNMLWKSLFHSTQFHRSEPEGWGLQDKACYRRALYCHTCFSRLSEQLQQKLCTSSERRIFHKYLITSLFQNCSV